MQSAAQSSKAAVMSNRARVVVALDFGTTFSGFAYARYSDPDNIFKFYEWPSFSKAGAKPYCKTQTSLYYAPSASQHGHFELKDWGWSAFVRFSAAARQSSASQHCPGEQHASVSHALVDRTMHMHADDDLFTLPPGQIENLGFFATKFKLYLAPNSNEVLPNPPENLTVETMVIDYLRCLSNFIISELQLTYGKHFGMEDVQWCLTVPAIWEEKAKQMMNVCAEKAGMVKGAACPTPDSASPYPLDMILEPEAASVYCQQKVKSLNLRKGNKILVADVGGGTIDLVLHEKADDDPESMRVHEIVGSYGETGGGTFVDASFFRFLSQKIKCFKEFCQQNTAAALKIYEWWQGIKMVFDGHGYSAELQLPRKLSEAWAKCDKGMGIVCLDEDYYDEVRLEDSDIMKIFNTEVDKVLDLIEKKIVGVRVLMVVGGFAASPYLRKRIKSRFEGRVEELIIPEEPGSAICHGAVQLHMGNDIIQSRLAKRTYGICMKRRANNKDPLELVFVDEKGVRKCDCCFDVFVRSGERMPLNKCVKRMYRPSFPQQREQLFELYSSRKKYPKYTTEVEVVEEGSFEVDMSEGMDLDMERSMEVSMVFGASLIHVSAKRLNFGEADAEQGLSVTFHKAN